MLDWYYDEDGAITNAPGIDGALYTVGESLDGRGFIAVEHCPNGKVSRVSVPTLEIGVEWCNHAAQQKMQPTWGTLPLFRSSSVMNPKRLI